MKKLVLICLAFAFSPVLAHAVVALSDSFSYTDGPLVTVSGGVWTHHSGTTTGEVNVVSGRVLLTENEGEDVGASLASGPFNSGNLYARFTINFSNAPSGTGGYFAHFKDNGASNYRAKIFATTAGDGAGTYRVGVANLANTPPAVVAMNLSFGSDYVLVVRYNTGAPATTIWVDPSSESDTNNSATASDSATVLGITTFALRQSLSSGNGMGELFLDDLAVGTSFSDVVTNGPPTPPIITTQPQSQTVTEGSGVTFTVVASGTSPLSYQWRFNGTNVPGATSASLTLSNAATNQAGSYLVVITNSVDSTNSQTVTLTVNPAPALSSNAFSLLNYNVKGNGASDWSTNSLQVQAIGRQVQYLDPDIITFQEIPLTNNGTAQMANFVAAFRPGYFLATNSGSDGFIRSVILSRFPITRSQKWLDSADLKPFGYTNTSFPNADNFTRDLFEAQISVPNFPQPLHVFTTHLKAGRTDPDDAAKRAAEASAISNFFVTGFLTTNSLRPYLLTGDLNEDIVRPATGSQQPIQRLTNGNTGLKLTTPLNPVTHAELTHPIQGSLDRRYDYILPNALLFSNIRTSQVFRTDLLVNPPPPLLTSDDITASDHLPVLMVFNNPYDKPFRLISLTRSNQNVALKWESVLGQPYRVDVSSNLTVWTTFATNLTATGATYTLSSNLAAAQGFFRVYRAPAP